ncbi:MAG: helix-turn-helix domain-containing protein [Elusimicrobiota bacterium]
MADRNQTGPKKTISAIIVKLPAEIGAIVRQTRKSAGLSQIEAASMCKVGTRFLSDLENGKSSIHLGKTMQVLRAFGLVVQLKKKTLTNE